MITVLPVPFWIVLVIVVLCIPAAARAESYTATSETGDSVTVYDQPCEFVGGQFKNWRKALLRWHGKDYQACWRAVGKSVAIFDSEGDLSAVPFAYFKEDKAI